MTRAVVNIQLERGC